MLAIAMRLQLRLILFFAFVAQMVTSRPTPSEAFPHFVVLDSRSENVWLYWKFDDISATFELHGNTTGWVGMGISPSGGMIGADLYVGWVKEGVSVITDRHGGSQNSYPSMDEEQNLELLGGEETDGWTRIKFRRQLAACEENVDLMITSSTLRIIWALGTSDPQDDDIVVGDYHGNGAQNRGVRSVLLLEPAGAPPEMEEEDTEFFDLLAGGIAVPAQETFYNCRYFELPQPASKRHIIRFEPIIQRGFEDIVHHILLYECREPPQNMSIIGRSHECYVANMPEDFRACQLTLHAWAIGGGTFYYPEHVGFPLGTPDAPRFVLTQTHYDNQARRSDLVDNSGLRMVYTKNLRRFDSGILEIGHATLTTLMVPPNAESFTITGECDASCVGRGMEYANTTELNIFAGLLHSHLLGRELRIRHFAANRTTEYPFITEDNSYDFNYQETRVFPQEIIFRRGESFQMVCKYNSIGKENFTVGGLSTENEMCLGFLIYYPRIPVTNCLSLHLPDTLFRFFNVFQYEFTSPPSLYTNLNNIIATAPANFANRTISHIVNSLEWDQARIAEFQEFTRRTPPRLNECEGRIDLENQFQRFNVPPVVTQPYQSPPPECTNPTSSPMPTTSSAHFMHGSFLLVVSTTTLAAILKWWPHNNFVYLCF